MATTRAGSGAYSGRTPDGPRADLAVDRDGRAERGARARRPGRAGGASGRSGSGPARRSIRACGPATWSGVREARPWTVDHRGAGAPAFPDEALAARCGGSSATRRRPGSVASLDVLHPSPGHATPQRRRGRHADRGALRRGRPLGVALAAVLIVTDAEGRNPLGDDEVRRARQIGGGSAASSRPTLTLKSRVRQRRISPPLSPLLQRFSGRREPSSRVRSSSCSSTSSSRCENERMRRSSRSTSPAKAG